MISAKEAIEDSGWLPNSETDSQRAGVMVGSGIGGLDGIRMSSDNLRRSPRKISPFFILLVNKSCIWAYFYKI